MADFHSINRVQEMVLLDDGESIPVTNWLDDEGDECEPEDAVVAVAGPDTNDYWHTIKLDELVIATIH